MWEMTGYYDSVTAAQTRPAKREQALWLRLWQHTPAVGWHGLLKEDSEQVEAAVAVSETHPSGAPASGWVEQTQHHMAPNAPYGSGMPIPDACLEDSALTC